MKSNDDSRAKHKAISFHLSDYFIFKLSENGSVLSVENVYCMTCHTRNSSGDEIANVNFLYDDIVHAVKIQ